jgi:L-alanine-DL-glutamate epimerase-like enolase superfamily enzyme
MPNATQRTGAQSSLRIRSVQAFPTSFPLPQNLNVRLGDGPKDDLARVAAVGKDGCVRPLEVPGLGIEVDEKFLKRFPVIEGPSYV